MHTIYFLLLPSSGAPFSDSAGDSPGTCPSSSHWKIGSRGEKGGRELKRERKERKEREKRTEGGSTREGGRESARAQARARARARARAGERATRESENDEQPSLAEPDTGPRVLGVRVQGFGFRV
jgi:hypothetical protein